MWLACNGETHGGKCLKWLKSIHTINRLKIKPIYSNGSECVSPIVLERVLVAAGVHVHQVCIFVCAIA